MACFFYEGKHFGQQIHDFQEKKVAELLDNNPFNLSNPQGVELAQREIQKEFEGLFPQIASAVFDQVKRDVSASVLINFTQRAHKV